MVLLRGHHLICLHFFKGKGYNQEFVDNLHTQISNAANEGVAIATGPDDVCRYCPYLKHERCNYSDKAEQEVNDMDSQALKFLKTSTGKGISWNELKIRLPAIIDEWFNLYCNECDWLRACKENKLFIHLTSHDES